MVDLSQMTLYHYCHQGCEPFHNIMRLPKEDAFRCAYALAEKNPQTTAFYRFADFANYYPLRLRTDELLYARFSTLGGKPKQKHPLFFVLGGSEFLYNWFDGGAVYCLPLSKIPEDAVSFTMGDSCAVTERGQEFTIYTKTQLADLLHGYAGTAEEYLQHIHQSCTYIEAQLWQDDELAYVYRSE